MGRLFTPEDDKTPGGSALRRPELSILAEPLRRDPDVIGEKLLVNGYPLTVIGVSQPASMEPILDSSPQIRIPVMMKAQISLRFLQSDQPARPLGECLRPVEAGGYAEQAQAGLQPLFHQMLMMEVQQKAFAHAAPRDETKFLEDVDRHDCRLKAIRDCGVSSRRRCWS